MQTPNVLQDFAELLRDHRVRKGMTQRQLADLSMVSVRAIRDLELGHTQRPQRNTVHLIADGLGLAGRRREAFMASACSQLDEESQWQEDLQLMSSPVPLTPLICREVQVAALGELVGGYGHRLVTVSGLPGVGKTRLLLEVAGLMHDTGRSPLLWSSQNAASPAGRAGQLQAAVRAAVGAAPLPTAGTRIARADIDSLATIVADRPVLLVLDGYEAEHLDATGVTSLLQSCRGLRIVITARVPAAIRGMRTMPLTPLAVPTPQDENRLAALSSVPSVRYLVRHLRHNQPGFELTAVNAAMVIELCRRLDGLPAALEIAAAWLTVYDLGLLVEYVRRDPFDLLSLLSDFAQQELGSELADAIDVLDPADAIWLDRLARAEDGWSVSDAVRLTGQPASACARLIGRLLERGMARPHDKHDQAGFAVLELVRARQAGMASAELVNAG